LSQGVSDLSDLSAHGLISHPWSAAPGYRIPHRARVITSSGHPLEFPALPVERWSLFLHAWTGVVAGLNMTLRTVESRLG
jgi:hypothetical protein